MLVPHGVFLRFPACGGFGGRPFFLEGFVSGPSCPTHPILCGHFLESQIGGAFRFRFYKGKGSVGGDNNGNAVYTSVLSKGAFKFGAAQIHFGFGKYFGETRDKEFTGMEGIVGVDSGHVGQIAFGQDWLIAPPNLVDEPIFWTAVVVRRWELENEVIGVGGNFFAVFQACAVLSFEEYVEAFAVDLDEQSASGLSKNERNLTERNGNGLSPYSFLFVVDNKLAPAFVLSGIEMKEYRVEFFVIGCGNIDTESFGIRGCRELDGDGIVARSVLCLEYIKVVQVHGKGPFVGLRTSGGRCPRGGFRRRNGGRPERSSRHQGECFRKVVGRSLRHGNIGNKRRRGFRRVGLDSFLFLEDGLRPNVDRVVHGGCLPRRGGGLVHASPLLCQLVSLRDLIPQLFEFGFASRVTRFGVFRCRVVVFVVFFVRAVGIVRILRRRRGGGDTRPFSPFPWIPRDGRGLKGGIPRGQFGTGGVVLETCGLTLVGPDGVVEPQHEFLFRRGRHVVRDPAHPVHLLVSRAGSLPLTGYGILWIRISTATISTTANRSRVRVGRRHRRVDL
jgi:hypothetical protein